MFNTKDLKGDGNRDNGTCYIKNVKTITINDKMSDESNNEWEIIKRQTSQSGAQSMGGLLFFYILGAACIATGFVCCCFALTDDNDDYEGGCEVPFIDNDEQ